MNFSQGTRGIIRALAIVLSVALPLAIAISEADARVGGGSSSHAIDLEIVHVPCDVSTIVTSTVRIAGRPWNPSGSFA